MTEAQDATGRGVKWLRYSARILALIWASVWTFHFVVSFFLPSVGAFSSSDWITITVLLMIPWATVAVAWRREAIGGLMLVVAGLLLGPWGWVRLIESLPGAIMDIMEAGDQMAYFPYLLLSFGASVPAPISGALFLASWWVSRTPAPPEATE